MNLDLKRRGSFGANPDSPILKGDIWISVPGAHPGWLPPADSLGMEIPLCFSPETGMEMFSCGKPGEMWELGNLPPFTPWEI